MTPRLRGVDRWDWFPLYHNDWMSDDKLAICGLEAQGLLMRLMCKAWKHGGRLNISVDELSVIASGDVEGAQRGLAELAKRNRIELKTKKTSDGLMYNIVITRLAAIYDQQLARHNRLVEFGKAGARAKKAKEAARAAEEAERAALLKELIDNEDEANNVIVSGPDVMPAITHRTTKKEKEILEKHGGGGLTEQNAEDIAVVSRAMRALTSTGKALGLSLAGGLKDRWSRTLLEVFGVAAKEHNVSMDKISRSFILRLKDEEVRDKLRRVTWVRPEFLRTDWPQYIDGQITREEEMRRKVIQNRVDQFYGGMINWDKEHGEDDAEHRATVIQTFWSDLAHEYNLTDAKLKEFGYEPPI